MLCTFTSKAKTLIIRSDDIRRIVDLDDHTLLAWIEGELICTARIDGTALENAARIQQEELDLIARIEDHRAQLQRRMAEGYPAVPVQRGRK